MSDEYLKLTTYFAERLRRDDRFLADALLDLYSESAVAISVVLRGIASFGPHHELRSDQTLSTSEDPPIAIAAVDQADKIAPLADRVVAMTTRGLVTLERARLLVGSDASAPPDTVKLTLYVGRQDRVSGRPAHQAVCDVLHRHGFAGASVFLGVDGTNGGQRQRARFFSRNVDVPVMIIAIGTGDQAVDAIPELEAMLRQPLLTLERVQLCKRDGRPHHPARRAACGRRERAGAVAEADGLHIGGHAARRRADSPRHRPTAPRLARRQRRDRAARHLGISRRPQTSRRQDDSALPARCR